MFLGKAELSVSCKDGWVSEPDTNLDYLHEPGEVELRVESEVVYIRDEGCNLFLKFVELLLDGVYAMRIVVVIVV